MDDYFNGFIGNQPSDFYFKYTNNGKKFYYTKLTGKLVKKDLIPSSILDQIEELKEDKDLVNLVQLVIKRDKLLNKIELIQKQLNDVNFQIEQNQIKKGNLRTNQEYETIIQDQIRNYKREKEVQNAKIKRRKQEYFHPPREVIPQINNILDKLKITTKKEWHQWLLNNHPDRFPCNGQICSEVILAGKQKGW